MTFFEKINNISGVWIYYEIIFDDTKSNKRWLAKTKICLKLHDKHIWKDNHEEKMSKNLFGWKWNTDEIKKMLGVFFSKQDQVSMQNILGQFFNESHGNFTIHKRMVAWWF